jgi:acyl carrier protein
MTEITEAVREYILKEFLPGEDPENLLDNTPLISGGILDSLATIKLVTFIEERYGVSVEPHERDEDSIGTVSNIVQLIDSKL